LLERWKDIQMIKTMFIFGGSKNLFAKSNKGVGVVGMNDVVIIETESEVLVVKEEKVSGIRDILKKNRCW